MSDVSQRPPWYYRLAIEILAPIYRLLVQRKSRHKPTLARELAERFGVSYSPVPSAPRGVIWCHAVSLGELNTAAPLIFELLNQGFAIWISSTTQTGFDRASKLFAEPMQQGKLAHSFLPIDKSSVIAKFLAHIQPQMALFIETELWANTLYELSRRQIPSVMVNARLAKKSYAGYAKFAAVSRSMMCNLHKIIAQNSASVERFIALGAPAEKVVLADSLKWSVQSALSVANQHLAEQMHAQLKQQQKTAWVAASTHAGEELLALLAQRLLVTTQKNTLLILVPRHPERFDEVYALCCTLNLRVARRSKNEPITADTQVYLADSMGELMAWYQVCQVAMVGGSFVPVGGHNPIEPASLAKPIIMGEYHTNCQVLIEALASVGAATVLQGQASTEMDEKTQKLAEQLAQALVVYFTDDKKAHQAGQAGLTLVQNKQNAVGQQLAQILSVLPLSAESDAK